MVELNSSFDNLFFFFTNIYVFVYDMQNYRNRPYLPHAGSLPTESQSLELCQPEARSQVVHMGFLCVWQGQKYLLGRPAAFPGELA